MVGWRDIPADLSNSDQISRVKNHLPSDAFVISSDLVRSVDTATAISVSSHQRLPHAPGLRELHFGVWDGMHFDDVSARDPDLSRAYWETPGDIQAPGGESWNMAAARISTVVTHLSARYPSAHIIAVAHFGAILTQVQRALAVPAYEVLAHRIDNLSITTIRTDGTRAEVERINHHP